MSDAAWAELMATARAALVAVPLVITAIGTILAAWWGYRAKTLGLDNKAIGQANAMHLVKQDATIAVVADVALVAAKASTAGTADLALRSRVNSLADDIAAIRAQPGPKG